MGEGTAWRGLNRPKCYRNLLNRELLVGGERFIIRLTNGRRNLRRGAMLRVDARRKRAVFGHLRAHAEAVLGMNAEWSAQSWTSPRDPNSLPSANAQGGREEEHSRSCGAPSRCG